MSLEGAQFICLDEAGNRGKIILPKGRKFTVGYYASCDFVLTDNDNRSEGIHCTIECDAFGRISIRNMAKDHPILLNGCVFENKRNLFNNSTITILDKQYLWLFSSKSDEAENELKQHAEGFTTPKKQIGFAEHSGFSSPSLKSKRGESRFTVHNFAYCIQSDEDGNKSIDTKSEEILTSDDVAVENPEKVQHSPPQPVSECELFTPGPQEKITSTTYNETTVSSIEQGTPKTNLISSTNNKENTGSTLSNNRLQLSKCHQSEIVITSFSPRETGVKTEKSFTAILLPKVLVTKAAHTPKSVYSTPKSVLGDDDFEDNGGFDKSQDINFHTPSTSKKAGCVKNSSMHLVDFTTPRKLAPASPYLKSALKASAKKLPHSIQKATKNIAATSDNQIGVTPLPRTPIAGDEYKGRLLETPGSVHSVISVDSTDTSSVIEILSDASTPGLSAAKTPQKCETKKTQSMTAATTPTRTPQSLVKRTIIGNINRQVTTPQRGTENTQTPRREPINRIPLRTSIGQLRSPVTPNTPQVTADLHIAHRRTSVSTPSRKSVSATLRFEGVSSSNKFASPSLVRRSLMPKSATKEPMTSTPLGVSGGNTTPLHKVRKSLGGVTLSSHISKTRKSIIAAAPPNFTSIKEKSPQQKMSDKILYRARKSSLGAVSPMIARAINIVQTAREKPSLTPSVLKSQRKSVADQILLSEINTPERGRTFILGVKEGGKKEEKNVLVNETGSTSKETEINNVTFSPRKEDDETNTDSTKEENKIINLTFSPKKDNDTEINEETPLDVNEVPECEDFTKSIQPETLSDRQVQNVNLSEAKQDEHIPTTSSQVTEDSFAEEIHDLQNEEQSVLDAINSKRILESGENEPGFGEENLTSIETVIDSKSTENVESASRKSITILDKSSGHEYKPICEDITLEESAIEKEIREGESSEGKSHLEIEMQVSLIRNEEIEVNPPLVAETAKSEDDVSLAETSKKLDVNEQEMAATSATENVSLEETTLRPDVSEKEISTFSTKADVPDQQITEVDVLEESSTKLHIPDKETEEIPATAEVSEVETSVRLDVPKQEIAEETEGEHVSLVSSTALDEPTLTERVSLVETLNRMDLPKEDNAKETEVDTPIKLVVAQEDIAESPVSFAETSTTEDISKQEITNDETEAKVASLLESATNLEQTNARVSVTNDVPLVETSTEENATEQEIKNEAEVKVVSLTESATKLDVSQPTTAQITATKDVSLEDTSIEEKEAEADVSLEETSTNLNSKSQDTTEIPATQNVSLKESSNNVVLADHGIAKALEVDGLTLIETSIKLDLAVQDTAENQTTHDVSLPDTSTKLNVPEKEMPIAEDISLSETSHKLDIPEQETTCKLLEEIDDVLNKSDEINQKHLIDQNEECESIQTLPDEFSSEKLTQDTNITSSEISETVFENYVLNSENEAEEQKEVKEVSEESCMVMDNAEENIECFERHNQDEPPSEGANSSITQESSNQNPTKYSEENQNVQIHTEIKEIVLEDTTEKTLNQITVTNTDSENMEKENGNGFETTTKLENNKSQNGNELEELNLNTIENKDVLVVENTQSDKSGIFTVNKVAETENIEEVCPLPKQSASNADDIIIEQTEKDIKDDIKNKESDEDINGQSIKAIKVDNKTEKGNTADLNQFKEITKIKSENELIINSPGKKLLESLKSVQKTPSRKSRRLSCSAVHLSVDSISANIDKNDTEQPSSLRVRTRRKSSTAEICIVQTPVKTTTESDTSATTTPRRNARRKSISTEEKIMLSTPKRLTRRSSMTAETTTTAVTPSKKSRRSSLSAVSETHLTPKRITRRRSSMSLDTDEVLEIKESKNAEPTPDIKEEEIREDMGAIIEEEEEEGDVINISLAKGEQKKTCEENDDVENLIENNLEDEIKEQEIPVLSENSEPNDTLPKANVETIQEFTETETITSKADEEAIQEEFTETETITSKADEEAIQEEFTETEIITSKADEEAIQESAEEIKTYDKSEFNLEEVIQVEEVDKMVEGSGVEESSPQELTKNEDVKLLEEDEEIMGQVVDVSLPDLNREEQTDICSENVAQEVTSDIVEDIPIHLNAAPQNTSPTDDTSICEELESETELPHDKVYSQAKGIDLNTTAEEDMESLAVSDNESNYDYGKEVQEPLTELIITVDSNETDILEVSQAEEVKVDKPTDPQTNLTVEAEGEKQTPNILLETPDVSDTTGELLLETIEKSKKEEKSIKKVCDVEENVNEMSTTASEITDNVSETEKSGNHNENKANENIQTCSSSTSEVNVKPNETPLKKLSIITDIPNMSKITENVGDTPKKETEQFKDDDSDQIKEYNKIKGVGDGVEEINEISEDVYKGDYKGVRELLKTPKGCSTPRFGGIRELMKTPKHQNSTPILSSVKDIMMMNTPPSRKEQKNLEQFLKTPTAKNIMIPTLPSSAIIEKPEDSVEMVHSIEYDLNDTHEGSGPSSSNLGELFKTPVSSRFIDRLSESYVNDEQEQQENEDISVSQSKTPHNRKSVLPTPLTESPFTTADILTDLSRKDVENWVDKMDPLVQSCIIEDENDVADFDNSNQARTMLDDSDRKNDSLSVVPETCEKSTSKNVSCSSEALISTTITQISSKDPLERSNIEKSKESHNKRPSTPSEAADISGIDLLDETTESVLENSMETIDYNDETNKLQNKQNQNIEREEDAKNDLSEPLLLSDDDDEDKAVIAETEVISTSDKPSTSPISLFESNKARVSEDLFENCDVTLEQEKGKDDTTTNEEVLQEDDKKVNENALASESIFVDDSMVETLDLAQETVALKPEKYESDSKNRNEKSKDDVHLVENQPDTYSSSQEVVCILDDTSDETENVMTNKREYNRKDEDESQEIISLCDDSTISTEASDENKKQNENKVLEDIISIDDSSSGDTPSSNKEVIDNDNVLTSSDLQSAFEEQLISGDNNVGSSKTKSDLTQNVNEVPTVKIEEPKMDLSNESEELNEDKNKIDLKATACPAENNESDGSQVLMQNVEDIPTISNDSSQSTNKIPITDKTNLHDSEDTLEQHEECKDLEFNGESKTIYEKQTESPNKVDSTDMENISRQEREESADFKICDDETTRTKDANIIIELSTSYSKAQSNEDSIEGSHIEIQEEKATSSATLCAQFGSIYSLDPTIDKMEHEEDSDENKLCTLGTESQELNLTFSPQKISVINDESKNITTDASPKTSVKETKENIISLQTSGDDVVEVTEHEVESANISSIKTTDIEKEIEIVPVPNADVLQEEKPNENISQLQTNADKEEETDQKITDTEEEIENVPYAVDEDVDNISPFETVAIDEKETDSSLKAELDDKAIKETSLRQITNREEVHEESNDNNPPLQTTDPIADVSPKPEVEKISKTITPLQTVLSEEEMKTNTFVKLSMEESHISSKAVDVPKTEVTKTVVEGVSKNVDPIKAELATNVDSSTKAEAEELSSPIQSSFIEEKTENIPQPVLENVNIPLLKTTEIEEDTENVEKASTLLSTTDSLVGNPSKFSIDSPETHTKKIPSMLAKNKEVIENIVNIKDSPTSPAKSLEGQTVSSIYKTEEITSPVQSEIKLIENVKASLENIVTSNVENKNKINENTSVSKTTDNNQIIAHVCSEYSHDSDVPVKDHKEYDKSTTENTLESFTIEVKIRDTSQTESTSGQTSESIELLQDLKSKKRLRGRKASQSSVSSNESEKIRKGKIRKTAMEDNQPIVKVVDLPTVKEVDDTLINEEDNENTTKLATNISEPVYIEDPSSLQEDHLPEKDKESSSVCQKIEDNLLKDSHPASLDKDDEKSPKTLEIEKDHERSTHVGIEEDKLAQGSSTMNMMESTVKRRVRKPSRIDRKSKDDTAEIVTEKNKTDAEPNKIEEPKESSEEVVQNVEREELFRPEISNEPAAEVIHEEKCTARKNEPMKRYRRKPSQTKTKTEENLVEDSNAEDKELKEPGHSKRIRRKPSKTESKHLLEELPETKIVEKPIETSDAFLQSEENTIKNVENSKEESEDNTKDTTSIALSQTLVKNPTSNEILTNIDKEEIAKIEEVKSKSVTNSKRNRRKGSSDSNDEDDTRSRRQVRKKKVEGTVLEMVEENESEKVENFDSIEKESSTNEKPEESNNHRNASHDRGDENVDVKPEPQKANISNQESEHTIESRTKNKRNRRKSVDSDNDDIISKSRKGYNKNKDSEERSLGTIDEVNTEKTNLVSEVTNPLIIESVKETTSEDETAHSTSKPFRRIRRKTSKDSDNEVVCTSKSKRRNHKEVESAESLPKIDEVIKEELSEPKQSVLPAMDVIIKDDEQTTNVTQETHQPPNTSKRLRTNSGQEPKVEHCISAEPELYVIKETEESNEVNTESSSFKNKSGEEVISIPQDKKPLKKPIKRPLTITETPSEVIDTDEPESRRVKHEDVIDIKHTGMGDVDPNLKLQEIGTTDETQCDQPRKVPLRRKATTPNTLEENKVEKNVRSRRNKKLTHVDNELGHTSDNSEEPHDEGNLKTLPSRTKRGRKVHDTKKHHYDDSKLEESQHVVETPSHLPLQKTEQCEEYLSHEASVIKADDVNLAQIEEPTFEKKTTARFRRVRKVKENVEEHISHDEKSSTSLRKEEEEISAKNLVNKDVEEDQHGVKDHQSNKEDVDQGRHHYSLEEDDHDEKSSVKSNKSNKILEDDHVQKEKLNTRTRKGRNIHDVVSEESETSGSRTTPVHEESGPISRRRVASRKNIAHDIDANISNENPTTETSATLKKNNRNKKKQQAALGTETHKPQVEDHTPTTQTEEKVEAVVGSQTHRDEVVNTSSEDATPHKRGRNVPQRRAATCHQSYDETSDSEKIEKKRRKPDSPRKSVEVAKNAQLQATVSETSTAVPSPTLSSSAVTARGRTRKPNARVQQFLEEERAKNDTPKRRAADTPTKGKKTRRGAKNVDSGVEVTADNKNVHDDDITSPTSSKGRKATRKIKATNIQHEDDAEEPPVKKSPATLEAEKEKETLSSEEVATPTRVAARRNAAAAATFRIKDYALDTDANEPPKKSRAKKQPAKALPVEEKTSEQSLVSAASQNEEVETVDLASLPTKAATKRAVARKADHTTDPLAGEPSLPAKRSRKGKVTAVTETHESEDEEHAASKSAVVTTRGGRKNVHFEAADQNQNSAVTAEETTVTNKRSTRARRK